MRGSEKRPGGPLQIVIKEWGGGSLYGYLLGYGVDYKSPSKEQQEKSRLVVGQDGRGRPAFAILPTRQNYT